MSLMSIPYPECDSIRLEFVDAWRSLRDQLSSRPLDAKQNAACLDQFDEDHCREARDTSRLWQAWRRQREHRVLTGHYAPVAIATGNSAGRN